jgi:uncharacterized membrane protein
MWSTQSWSQSIIFLPDLPGGTHNSVATGVSNNGVVSGYTFFASNNPEAFVWSQTNGITPLDQTPTATIQSGTFGISEDGSTIVGGAVDANGGERAVSWSTANPSAEISLSPSPRPIGNTAAEGASADGSVIVGADNDNAVVWSAGGETPIAPLAQANAVSSPGKVVVGGTIGTSSKPDFQAFSWTSTSGFTPLNYLPGGTISVATAVSADGSVIAGGSDDSNTPGSYVPVRWTASGVQSLGTLGTDTLATGMSADGSIIVGWADHQSEAFIWDATNGIRLLSDVLESDGVNLNGFQLQQATGISTDGQYITGFTGDFGDRTAWLVQLPEPTGLSLVMIGAEGILIRRRRKPSAKLRRW